MDAVSQGSPKKAENFFYKSIGVPKSRKIERK